MTFGGDFAPDRGFRQTALIIVIFEAAEIASHVIPWLHRDPPLEREG